MSSVEENLYSEGQDLLKEIRALPPLPESVCLPPVPPLDTSMLSDFEEAESDLPSPPPAETSSIFPCRLVSSTCSPCMGNAPRARASRREGVVQGHTSTASAGA